MFHWHLTAPAMQQGQCHLIPWEAGSVVFPLLPGLRWRKKLCLCFFHTLDAAVSPLTFPSVFRSLCFLGLPCLYHCRYRVCFDKQNRTGTLYGFRTHCQPGIKWSKQKTSTSRPGNSESRYALQTRNLNCFWFSKHLWSWFSYYPSVYFHPVKKVHLPFPRLLTGDYWKCATEHTVILALFCVYVQ